MNRHDFNFKAFMAGAVPGFGLGNWFIFNQIHIDTSYWMALVGVGVGKLAVNLAFAFLTGVGTNRINTFIKKRKQDAKRPEEKKSDADATDKTNAA